MKYSKQELKEITECVDLEPIMFGLSTTKFKAKYDNENVVIRIYDDLDFYNRYQREGYYLDILSKNKESINFEFPRIIKDIPSQHIRVISWLDGVTLEEGDILSSLKDIERILHLINRIEGVQNHNTNQFTDELTKLFQQTHMMNKEVKNKFNQLVQCYWNDETISRINNHPQAMIHGDFFNANIIRMNDHNKQFGLIDWEFANIGSCYYDMTYYYYHYNILNQIKKDIDLIDLTDIINCVVLVMSHWYFSYAKFYPKLYHQWNERLRREKRII